MRNTKLLSMLLVAIISSFFFVNKVNAYFTSNDSRTNTFTIAEFKTLTKEYYVLDENNQQIQVRTSETSNTYVGDIINISDTLTSYDCNNIKHYINGSLYNSNTYTIAGDTTVKEVCELNTYTITYTLNNGTLNNPPRVYSSFTPTFNLPTPTRNNYRFTGWCVGNGNNNCSDPYTVTQGSTGNISVSADWVRTYTVTHNNGNFTYSGEATADAGATYTATITPTGNYSISNNSTVRMGNRTLTRGTGYTLTNSGNNSYVLSIPNVNGNITINIETTGNTCLGEGTEVMLWDGTTKRIEDVRYNDLLKVWNHDTGTYGYTYPAWIEKAGITDHYTKVTFSDGTVLDVIIDHRVFSRRLNKYVNIISGDLVVGDEVVSLKDGFSYVTIVSMEEVEEEIEYYNIITTRYFNIIADGLLVTYELYDDVSSNYKGFDSNMRWLHQTPEEEKISYEEFINTYGYVDRYLYKSLKLEDVRYAIAQGYLTQEELATIMNDFMLNDDYRLETPKDGLGNNLWMVTTSDDTNPSSPLHQMVEGDIYTVPTPNNEENFLYWYNSSDNKYYQPGDQIEVDSSMYLEAIYN